MKENNQNKLIAGIDGSKGGWVCVSSDTNNTKKPKFDIFNKFEEVIAVSYTHLRAHET